MRRIKAFSLMETTLSLLIIGLIISMIFPLYKIINTHRKMMIDEEKYTYIRIAMQNYLLQHGHLPCASNNDSGNCDNIYSGYLPYRELGIKKSYMLDSNNKPFTYAVHKDLTKTNIPIHMPYNIPPVANNTSFARIYKFAENKEILKYDDISNDLILLQKGKDIISEKDHFYIMPPTKKFSNSGQMKEWLREAFQEEVNKTLYKTENKVAWLLVSHGSKKCTSSETNSKKGRIYCLIPFEEEKNNFEDKVFYQTRFDMLAQIGLPTTSEPLYDLDYYKMNHEISGI